MEEEKKSELGPLPPIIPRNNQFFLQLIDNLFENEDEEANPYQDLWNGEEELINIPTEIIQEEISYELSEDDPAEEDTLQYSSRIRDDRWLCPICLDLLSDPVETPCCHNLFCEKCVRGLVRCPLCNRYMETCAPNIPVRRILDDMVIKCRHQLCDKFYKRRDIEKHEKFCEMALMKCRYSRSCGDIVRKDLETHEAEECNYRPVECPMQCTRVMPKSQVELHLENSCVNVEVNCPQQCGEKTLRGNIENHISQFCNETIIRCLLSDSRDQSCDFACPRKFIKEHQDTCEFRLVQCENEDCEELIVIKDSEDHQEECLFKEIKCPNDCGDSMLRRDEAQHRAEDCELEEVTCTYCCVGCSEQVMRKNYSKHLEDNAQVHSLMMVQGFTQMNKAIETLQSEMRRLKMLVKDKDSSYYRESLQIEDLDEVIDFFQNN